MTRQSEAFNELLSFMELEPLEDNLFRGVSRDIGTERVFGGQVLAQALMAASHTVEDRQAHSLHAYFLRAGDHNAPIVYDVDRSRDGRSFSARRVVAIQHGRPIFTLAASFQVKEEGLEHQFEMPDVPPPGEVAPIALLPRDDFDHMPKSMQRWMDRFGPFEFRAVRGSDPDHQAPQPPFKELWFKLHGQLDDDPKLHRIDVEIQQADTHRSGKQAKGDKNNGAGNDTPLHFARYDAEDKSKYRQDCQIFIHVRIPPR